MYSVNYHRASSVEDALKVLETGDAKPLSGGMTLIPAMKTRLAAPSDLVDLSQIADLKGIKVSGKTVTIGAGATHFEVATNRDIESVAPTFCRLASLIGDPAVRYKGTIGGSIANNDPAADYPGALVALDATITTTKRTISAEEFFTGLFETALEDGELVTSISFDAPLKAGYEKFRNPASRYAIVGVFVAQVANGVRVAVIGAGDNGVFRSSEMEKALAASFDPAAVQDIKVPSTGLMSDLHASADYRSSLITVMAKRAVTQANG